MNDDAIYLDERLDILCDGTDIDPREYTVIRKDELDVYIEAINKLAALEDYGVDNWEGYGEAMESLYNEEEE